MTPPTSPPRPTERQLRAALACIAEDPRGAFYLNLAPAEAAAVCELKRRGWVRTVGVMPAVTEATEEGRRVLQRAVEG